MHVAFAFFFSGIHTGQITGSVARNVQQASLIESLLSAWFSVNCVVYGEYFSAFFGASPILFHLKGVSYDRYDV